MEFRRVHFRSKVMVNGKRVSKIELAINQVVNKTLLSANPRNLNILLQIFDKYGALPEIDRRAEAEAGAEAAMQKIFSIFDQTVDDDPAIGAELDRHSREEAALIMSCPHCGPELTARWGEEDRKTFSARHGKTGLHKDRKSTRLNSSH